jgi:hypothetical protein
MACPLCGDPCICSRAGDLSSERTTVLIDPDQIVGYSSRSIAVGQAASTEPGFYRPNAADWRNEVTSRLRAHRRRRGYDPDASLALGFAPPEPEPPPPAAMAAEFASEHPEPVIPPPPPAPSRYQRIAMNRRQAQMENGVLIEFPRPQNLDLFTDDAELAEPLPSVPRILEAPEPEVAPQPSTIPVLTAIELDTATAEDHYEPVTLELPLQVAPFSPRTVCALIDAVLVLTGSALFTLIVLTIARFVPEGKLALALGTMICIFFWSIYQYLFLVYAGVTPGMQMAQLELTSFEGCVPARRTRAHRALASVLSCISLGMGFVWSLFDEDSLGWHDRITRTYLRQS